VPIPRPSPRRCPEIDCVRHLISPSVAAAAERRAVAIGVGTDRVLIAGGLLTEETYVAALASWLGVAFESLDAVGREAFPFDDERLLTAGGAGLLPIVRQQGLRLVVAPRGWTARRLIAALDAQPALRHQLALTTSARLRRFLMRHAATVGGDRAAHLLRTRRPDLSAATAGSPLVLGAFGCTLVFGIVMTPAPIATVIGLALSALFLTWSLFRIMGALAVPPQAPPRGRIPDRDLPIYTIIVALYREAAAVPHLITALRQLDYPPEKLDIKLVLEADDQATLHALEHLALTNPFEIIIAPALGPRTKPKALNVALPFARGAFTVIYDAEDRPEPDQLRRVVATFMAGDERLACVQALLTVDNTEDSWLTRLFTAEYGGLFDVLLPALARGCLPLPLGGSSNHFRTAILHRLGGWDPYNVTEDADIGIRLARFGYRATTVASTTYEEAPASIRPWLKQRTRWLKGWMQTWLVHMRMPLRLKRELGLSGFVTFQLMVGGSVLAALIHPIFAGMMLAAIVSGSWSENGALLPWLYGGTVLAGYAASALLGYVGLARRGLHTAARVLVLTPVHWVLLSIAAWRALVQLIADPHRWEKTEHGLARTSRCQQRH
jgi:cellulose synthase/poly-beta-1,6-N-acetylglucosamine synthase-like glycosyltransferase